MNPFLKISTHSSQILIASCRKLTEAMNLPLPLHRSRHRLPARRLHRPVPKTRFMCSLTRVAGMENLRAYMLVTALTEAGVEATYEPSDVDSNPDSAATIVDKGFLLHFSSEDALQSAIQVVKGSSNIQTYEVRKIPQLRNRHRNRQWLYQSQLNREAVKSEAPPAAETHKLPPASPLLRQPLPPAAIERPLPASRASSVSIFPSWTA